MIVIIVIIYHKPAIIKRGLRHIATGTSYTLFSARVTPDIIRGLRWLKFSGNLAEKYLAENIADWLRKLRSLFLRAIERDVESKYFSFEQKRAEIGRNRRKTKTMLSTPTQMSREIDKNLKIDQKAQNERERENFYIYIWF